MTEPVFGMANIFLKNRRRNKRVKDMKFFNSLIFLKLLSVCVSGLFFLYIGDIPVYAAQPVTVVLDPGHGGGNLGAEYNGYTEKDMTMIVASAMKEELEKYEGIKVYLTREGDKDMSLEDRAEFAASKNADFLFCLHFNMSLSHNLFGSEVWTSAFGEEYQEGYAFASAEMELLEDAGLYPRGIKTRLNDDGEDYYGIIRHSTARGIPSVIIEHCHLDQENDVSFYDTEEKLRRFGILDATAAAKYYGLKSEILGVDYSGYRKTEIPLPDGPVKPDLTEPDVCMIDVEQVKEETGDVSVSVYASDYDSYITYYSYSWDGGESFSDLQRWEPRNADFLNFTIHIPSGTVPDIVVNVYNKYDLSTASNHIYLPSMVYGQEKQEENAPAQDSEDAVEAGIMTAENNPEAYKDKEQGSSGKIAEKTDRADIGEQDASKVSFSYFLQVAFLCAAILFVLLMLAGILMKGRSSKKKRRRKK